jgi:hypothetical protein
MSEVPLYSLPQRAGNVLRRKWGCMHAGLVVATKASLSPPRKVDTRLSGKRNSDSHGARPVY